MDAGWEDAIKRGDVRDVLDLRDRGTGFAGKTAYDLAMEHDMRELPAALKPKP
jgi:hypothetical protein